MVVVRFVLGSKYNREHNPIAVTNGPVTLAAGRRCAYSVVEP
jgi:hypothetical protein